MDRIPTYPKTTTGPSWTGWLRSATNRFNMYQGDADPVDTEVPQGQWILYKNTTSGEIRWWVNDDGTMKKSAAFT